MQARTVIVALLILLLFPPLLKPQDVDLRLRSSYGFDGIVRPGRWNPLYITLSNFADPTAGTLSVRLIVNPGSLNNETTWTLTEEVDLGKGESLNRRYVLPVARGSLPVRLSLVRDGEVLLEEEILPPLRYTPEELIVALSSGAISRASGLSVAYPLMEHLPERWQGYSGVDLLILADPPLQRLSPQQWYALQEWLSFGGTALITKEREGKSGTNPEITALWEAGAEVSSRETLLSRRFGDGLLLLDHAEGPSLPRTLRRIIADRRSHNPVPPLENNSRPFADGATAALIVPGVYHYPSRWILALALLVTIASLALLTRAGQTRPRMSRLAPLLVPGLLALAFGAIFSSSAAPPEALAVEVQRLRADQGRGTSLLLEREILLMTTQRRSYRVTVPEKALLLPNAGRANGVEPTREGGSAVAGAMDDWGRVYLGTLERRHMDFSVTLLPEEHNLRIRNQTGLVLTESALVTRRHTYPTGAVSPGQEVYRPLSEEGAYQLSQSARRHVNELKKDRELREQLLAGALFVGWSPRVAEPLPVALPFAGRITRGVVIIPIDGEVSR